MRTRLFWLFIVLFIATPAALEATPSAPSRLYLSPMPGARNISPTTAIALRQGDPFDQRALRVENLIVTGSRSGPHSGQLRLSDDRLTLLFYPDQPFAYDEAVTVATGEALATANREPVPATSFQFHTLSRPVRMPARADAEAAASPADHDAVGPYVTHPEFTSVMPITVTTVAQNAGNGFLFMTGLNYQAMLMVDDDGEPVFIKQVADGLLVSDFKRQDVGGVPLLSYHEGVPVDAWTNGVYHVMDQTYNVVDTWTIGNGYGADLHELQLLDNGHALLLSYTPIPWDLSPYGGPEDGVVIDAVVQEQDSNKNVVFEWHASQHLPLTDTFSNLAISAVDYVHTNAIEVDVDDNLLLSHRNTNSVVKVDRQTGQVIWVMGGRRNQFVFTNDIGFSRQHDIRRLANGSLTLFDNGNSHLLPRSRAVEYRVNEVVKRVTRVWQYSNDRFSPYMGNAQRLSNGNTVIGWGAVPSMTEVLPDGTKALEMDLGGRPYRVFRFPWDGQPAEPPRAVVAPDGPNQVAVYFSWNGAAQVDAYQVYAGPTSQQMALMTTVNRTGFETSVVLAGLPDDTCAFKVRPINHDGQPAPYSNVAWRVDLPACRSLLNWSYLPLIVQ